MGLSTGEGPCRQDCKFSILGKSMSIVQRRDVDRSSLFGLLFVLLLFLHHIWTHHLESRLTRPVDKVIECFQRSFSFVAVELISKSLSFEELTLLWLNLARSPSGRCSNMITCISSIVDMTTMINDLPTTVSPPPLLWEIASPLISCGVNIDMLGEANLPSWG